MIRILLFVVACCTFANAIPWYRNSGNENELYYQLRELELPLKRTEEPSTGKISIVGKPSGQSSTYVHYGQQLSADLANDGNSDANLHEGRSCSHTKTSNNPCWWVDLGDTHVIRKVEIVNRGDCCSERLEGATVHVALDKDQALLQQSSDQCGSPVTADQASVPGGTVSIECSRPLKGRFIVIGILRSSVVLQLCEVKVFEPPTAKLSIVGKPADQSSTYVHYGQQLSADLANDGNSDSDLHEGRSCSHTKSGDNLWWRVDLGDIHVISKVEIVNRGDCCSERLEGATVHVALDREDSLLQQSSDQCGSPVTADQASIPGGTVTVKCDRSIGGRYIVIGIPGSSVSLQLCEVGVWEVVEPLTAELSIVGKPADQSSTYVHYSQHLSADLANDGNSDSNLGKGRSCSHTKTGDNPWWEVDLGGTHVITKVEIVNRGDCCPERLEGATVHVALDREEFLQQSGDQCGSPVTADQASVSGGTVTVKCDHPLNGQFIVIRIPKSSIILQLCEVKVWEILV